MTESNRSALFWGVVLVLAGLAFLLSNFNVLPSGINLWPLLAMGAGIWLLGKAVARRRGGLVAGIVLLALGVFWLLENYGRVDDRFFLPVLLIALGTGLLLRNLLRARQA